MDRYQFEDAISAYLDNELNLSDRQAFESYMNANPDAKALVPLASEFVPVAKALTPLASVLVPAE